MVEKILFLKQILEMEIIMDLHFLKSPEFEKKILVNGLHVRA